MNEAIMEEGGGKKGKKKSNDNDEICRLANAAVERFLKSPPRPATSTNTKTTSASEKSVSNEPNGLKSDEATKVETVRDAPTENESTIPTQKEKIGAPTFNLDISSDESDDEITRRLAEKNKRAKEHDAIIID